MSTFARGEISGVLTVPWSFKPSSLIGEGVTSRGGMIERRFEITRAYTLRKLPGRKRIRFVAEEQDQ
jgi:hypothetical protein